MLETREYLRFTEKARTKFAGRVGHIKDLESHAAAKD
jgi:hypothetical protein